MNIFVETLSGKVFVQPVDISFYTVDTLKYRIMEKTGNPSEPTEIEFAGIQLEDGRKLSEYKIVHGSTVKVVPRPVGVGMKIFVLSMVGMYISLQVERSDTIDDVIAKVEAREGYSVPGFIVKFGDYCLADRKKTLANYGIEDGNKISFTIPIHRHYPVLVPNQGTD